MSAAKSCLRGGDTCDKLCNRPSSQRRRDQVFSEQLSMQIKGQRAHGDGQAWIEARSAWLGMAGRIKDFITGARLVVKNYIPFMTKILQNSLSPFPSEPYSFSSPHLPSLLIEHLNKRIGLNGLCLGGGASCPPQQPAPHSGHLWLWRLMGSLQPQFPVYSNSGGYVVYYHRHVAKRWNVLE